jgi:hypothetical protein
VIAAVFLWLRGYWKPHWGGVALGAAVTIGSLVPYFVLASEHPEIWPGSDGRTGLGLLQLWPPLKGVSYWLRYPSLYGSAALFSFDFTPGFGAAVERVLRPAFMGLGYAAGVLTVIPVLVANIAMWRRRRVSDRKLKNGRMSSRAWLRGYAIWLFVAGIVANALSPTSVMWWHNLILFHATLLPVVLWLSELLRTRHAPRVRAGLWAYTATAVVLLLGMTLASEHYRHGGREPEAWVLQRNDQIVRDLSLERYGVSIDPEGGSYPINNGFFYTRYVAPFTLPAE